MDHWGFFIIILFLPGCEMMKPSAVAGVWWVPLEVQLSCPVPSQVKWQFSTWGYVVDDLKDRKEEELEYFQGY